MNAPSPLILSGDLTSFTIRASETEIPTTYQVVSIDTWMSVNRLPKARLVIYDGTPSAENFPISSADTFLPGKKVEIAVGYDQKNTVIFEGIVVEQGIEINQTGSSKVVVEITDQAMAMTLARRNAVFSNVKDSDLISSLIGANGLSASVASTQTVYEDIVQYYSTDWDLMVMRAELNSFVVTASAGKVTVGMPDTSQSPVLTLTYGESILDLELQMDAATQYAASAIKSYSWDDATQKMISADLATTFNISSFPQQTGAGIPSSSLQEWSTAELLKSQLSKIRGKIRFQGSALAQPGKMVQLSGLGDRFDGAAYISGVHHNVTEGRWLTTVTIGLAWQWFAGEAPRLAAPGASGQLPPMQGLQTGIVKQVATDPAGEFRVQVTIPILGDDSKSVWARLGSFYASNKAGAVFYPEVGDELILAFMNNDSRSPVIVGSVYSKTIPPPYPPDQKNTMKAIVTRNKLEMTFNDEDKVIEIKTPGNRSVKLDDKAGTITISDPNKNTITLASGGITIDSASNMTLKAKGNITIDAGGNLAMSATANATLKGVQISHNATAKFAAQGATSEVTASAMLTLRGALVQIN
jgi:Rhs element Vgr protein